MNRSLIRSLVVFAAFSWHGPSAAQAPSAQQPPRFRTGVDLLSIDVGVIDGQGRPVPNLAPSDFKVFVDDAERRVVNAEFVSLVGNATPPATASSAPEGYSTNHHAAGGRLIVLAVDQPNIRLGGGRLLIPTIDRFIDHLSPSDRIAAVGLGLGAASTPFTADREQVKTAIRRMNGQRQVRISRHEMDLESAQAIAEGNSTLVEILADRDCPQPTPTRARPQTPQQMLDRELCKMEIRQEATSIGDERQRDADVSIRALLNLLNGLRSIDGPKTVVLISEGIALLDRDMETAARLAEVGSGAAAARTSVYALRLDDQLIDLSRRNAVRPFENGRPRMQGLATLTTAARGTLFTVTALGDAIFDRIERELSGYYLLGVESAPRDADGKPRPLRVEVAKPGVTVRARRQFVAPMSPADTPPKSPREAVAAALMTPLAASALPLRAISFNLQDSDSGNVQLLIHVDIGTGYTSPQSVALAYTIHDRQGRMVDSQSFAGRLRPAVTGIASALPFVAGTSLAPGEYTLKLAAAAGGKVGSVEHAIRALLNNAGPLKLSDLILGGPVPSGEPTRPTVDDVVRFGVVHGYLEAYGATAPDLQVRYEVASDDRAPALISADVAGRSVSESRTLFNKLVPTGALPPGRYRLRATVSVSGAPVSMLSRAFEIAAPSVLSTTSSAVGDAPSARRELFLPIEARDLAIPFQPTDALRAETLQSFAERVPPALKPPFDEGVAHLRAGDYASAERSFKRAIETDVDATAPLAYLAVSFAASGRDFEASSAWQTALVRGSDVPQIYQWLGDALLRARELSRARAILEEAAGRWPDDNRFARPLAMLYAMLGRGYEAVRLLERYIGDGHSEADTLYLGVQWIFQVHADGGVVHSRAEDLTLARGYAEQYARVKGPKQALVKQWIGYLERQR